jgi:hypothetical protein
MEHHQIFVLPLHLPQVALVAILLPPLPLMT